MVNIALPKVLTSMGGSCYTHDAMRGRCGGIGVEDARIARKCGDEIVLVEAAKHSYILEWYSHQAEHCRLMK